MPENLPSTEHEISLREYLEAQIEGVRRELMLIQEAQRIAISKAEEAQQLRNEAQNEWRGTVTDIMARSATRDQLVTIEKGLRGAIEALEKAMDGRADVTLGRISSLELKGRSEEGARVGRSMLIAAVVGAVAFIIMVITFLLRFTP